MFLYLGYILEKCRCHCHSLLLPLPSITLIPHLHPVAPSLLLSLYHRVERAAKKMFRFLSEKRNGEATERQILEGLSVQ